MLFFVFNQKTQKMEQNRLDTTSYILDTLIQKSVAKQEAYTCTLEQFIALKKVMKFLIENYKKQLKEYSQKINLHFSENGVFEAKMQVAGDMLVFDMHSNIFAFDEKHWIWKNEYVKKDNRNSYCGVISVYNFLADSFKYKRLGDYGYIVARVFINREGYFFLDGDPDFSLFNENFGKNKLDVAALREITQLIIQYSLEADLLIPSLENMQITTVKQMIAKTDKPKVDTGKPMGFQINAK